MQYEGKLKCDRCKKPIGELIRLNSDQVHHQPYMTYRKYGIHELCGICYNEVQDQERRTAWKRETGIV